MTLDEHIPYIQWCNQFGWPVIPMSTAAILCQRSSFICASSSSAPGLRQDQGSMTGLAVPHPPLPLPFRPPPNLWTRFSCVLVVLPSSSAEKLIRLLIKIFLFSTSQFRSFFVYTVSLSFPLLPISPLSLRSLSPTSFLLCAMPLSSRCIRPPLP